MVQNLKNTKLIIPKKGDKYIIFLNHPVILKTKK